MVKSGERGGGRREEGVGGRREGRQSDIFNFFGC